MSTFIASEEGAPAHFLHLPAESATETGSSGPEQTHKKTQLLCSITNYITIVQRLSAKTAIRVCQRVGIVPILVSQGWNRGGGGESTYHQWADFYYSRFLYPLSTVY